MITPISRSVSPYLGKSQPMQDDQPIVKIKEASYKPISPQPTPTPDIIINGILLAQQLKPTETDSRMASNAYQRMQQLATDTLRTRGIESRI